MDIETYRWFMSTVPQVLGAVTAIILAGYFVWLNGIRGGVAKALEKLFKYEEIDKDRLNACSKIDVSPDYPPDLKTFIDVHNQYASQYKAAKRIKTPIIISFVVITLSLLALLNDIWICGDALFRIGCTYIILVMSVLCLTLLGIRFIKIINWLGPKNTKDYNTDQTSRPRNTPIADAAPSSPPTGTNSTDE